ncbi:Hypothetical protein PAS_chr2-1_0790 [Komagataella phaffii GS115]|uniref:Uncharacterized protein n=1 Tax=Komagataella phaffii (strain GS115 / ATCC 20864) TaxID=644223 RepID=C4R1S4_KOMPG|nr:Hypothetical protein PAS_chr2-1_0790 [Komagataella phaffii GS115]AOA62559.1 GQ67_00864T0 [Komagataella phaffii]AOA68165.1 GQ68_00525T0 [Komagataella phaffii GS115]CAH2448013.1 Conserved predicted protein [Komagataella phaffii CBS 7435]CAY69448.1 Hypothetical protein PAS_chr2-1_0790 [Komagataella phaffii GS115]
MLGSSSFLEDLYVDIFLTPFKVEMERNNLNPSGEPTDRPVHNSFPDSLIKNILCERAQVKAFLNSVHQLKQNCTNLKHENSSLGLFAESYLTSAGEFKRKL